MKAALSYQKLYPPQNKPSFYLLDPQNRKKEKRDRLKKAIKENINL